MLSWILNPISAIWTQMGNLEIKNELCIDKTGNLVLETGCPSWGVLCVLGLYSSSPNPYIAAQMCCISDDSESTAVVFVKVPLIKRLHLTCFQVFAYVAIYGPQIHNELLLKSEISCLPRLGPVHPPGLGLVGTRSPSFCSSLVCGSASCGTSWIRS